MSARPTVEWPSRRLMVVVTHDTIEDGLFYPHVSRALKAYAEASMEDMGATRTEPFIHGDVRIDVIPYKQTFPRHEEWHERLLVRWRLLRQRFGAWLADLPISPTRTNNEGVHHARKN